MDNGNSGGGEVTRVNIVYFLSRDGKVEHPHLIRVHHRHRGIRLQDVKRWLSELRGKEMPDTFAWSYKRRYKTGHVWQDLKDDDLITPISDNQWRSQELDKGWAGSMETFQNGLKRLGWVGLSPPTPLCSSAPADNEYVLKGSWIPCTPSAATNIDSFSSEEKTPNSGQLRVGEEMPAVMIRHKPSAEAFRFDQPDDDIIVSPPPELDKDSRTAVFKIDMHRHVKAERRPDKVAGGRTCTTSTSAGRASHVFRNIVTCGLVETNDSALRPVDRQDRERFASGSAPLLAVHRRTKSTGNGKSSAKAGEKAVPAIYRPTATPVCSQCAKNFRPEKFHSHMKSCKALKGHSNGVDLKRMPTKTGSCSQEFSKATKSGLLTH